ncbi:MAG: DUF5615 family PIN-like protein [Acidimicrobiales bacterium]
MRLLLDVHHSPHAAQRLRDDGHDVLAGAVDPALAGLDDEELLRVASRDRRCVVTENVRDFGRIVRAWSAVDEHHEGMIFTPPRRFHRGAKSYPENLVRALAVLLGDPPQSTRDWVRWLD